MGFLVREGRLSVVPIYDDVVYLIDGLKRLEVLYSSGIVGFFADLYIHPAHSPFTAVASTFGFLFSGGAVWGPYLLNSAWVFVFSGLALVVLRELNVWSRIGIVAAVLAAPMLGSVVAEFRPDPVWGLLVGFSLAILASIDVVHARPSRLFVLGMLFGVAALAKPTASPATVLVLGVGLAMQIGVSLIAQKSWSIESFVRRAVIVFFGAALLVTPYIVTNGLGILSYILTVMGSESTVWRTDASTLGHITYYLNRSTGSRVLGWIWYFAIPLLILCGSILTYAKDKRALSAFAGIGSALAMAYAIVTVSEVKSAMIGSILYGTIIAAVTWSLGQIVSHVPIRRSMVCFVGILIFLTQWVPRAGMIQRTDPAVIAIDEANRIAFPAVLQALEGAAKTVIVTVPGPVYAGTLDFLARQQRASHNFTAAYTWNTWELFAQGIAAADAVVLSEPGMRGQALGFNFPSVQFQNRLLNALQANPDFSGKPVFSDADGKSVWLFIRR